MMQENTGFMKDFKPLSETERTALQEVVKVFKAQNLISCTSCRYCMEECPKGTSGRYAPEMEKITGR